VGEGKRPVLAVIVPDDELRGQCGQVLEAADYRVVPVSDFDDALPQLASSRAELAFVQLSGDQPGGLELVTTLNHEFPLLPVIGVIHRDELQLAEQVLEAGAADLLCYPFESNELTVRVASHVRIGGALRRLKRRQDENQVILELTQTLASSLDFDEILYHVVRRIAGVIKVDRCSIVLTGRAPTMGYVVASSEDPTVHDLQIDLGNYPEVQEVIETAKPLVLHVGSDPLLDAVRNQLPANTPALSALFPITHESGVLGVLFLRFRARTQELSDRELALCQTVATATAIALRNARVVGALRDEQARIVRAHDEAERKVEALSHYADFFESSADGMLVVDADGNVRYANPRLAAMTGRSLKELVEGTLADLVVDEDRPILGRLFGGFARGAYPRGLDLTFKGAFDEPIVASVSASSTLRLEQGVLLILRDVTSARATEAELRRTKEFLEALIAQSVDAIIASDMQGNIVLFNPGAQRILGYRSEEVLGEDMLEQFFPEGLARRIMDLLVSPEHGGPGRLEQTRAKIMAKDGTEVPISMTGGMIAEDGLAQATFWIFTDLRERLEIENDLARMRLELMEREREAIAAQLAGAAAHELNQPLTSVMAAVELLRRRLGDDSAHGEVVEKIVDQAERMARIVKKIGQITHYETTAYVGSTRILDLSKTSSTPSEMVENDRITNVPDDDVVPTAMPDEPTGFEEDEITDVSAQIPSTFALDARDTEHGGLESGPHSQARRTAEFSQQEYDELMDILETPLSRPRDDD
jgi:PAS domain S-box-containing protein